jgi:hypothetical protein
LTPQASQLLNSELSQRIQQQVAVKEAPEYWKDWLTTIFPAHFTKEFGDHHIEFWEWVDAIRPGIRPAPFISIWARGGGKSTDVEASVVYIGHKRARKYAWYIRETQDQADKSVENIGAMLESYRLADYDPLLADRAVGKYGKPRAWRRNRLRTASGLTVDAMGLDTALRGAKVEEARPDLIIFDDIDGLNDTAATTHKKEGIITQSILPAEAFDLAVMVVQNLIIEDGIVSRLAKPVNKDGADYLIDRIISGPHPAIEGLTYEQNKMGKFIITGGAPVWEGQNLETAQDQINTWGLTAFLREAQHEVDTKGGMYDHIEFRYCERHEVPDLVRTTVWVDPAVTSTDKSDNMGIQADGIAEDGIIYRLFSWESITSPEDALRRAILKAIELGSLVVGVETDQGGDTWMSVFARAIERIKKEFDEEQKDIPEDEREEIFYPGFAYDKAGAGHGNKVHRGQQMLVDYENGMIVHVRGTHGLLGKALGRFPNKPLDLADAAYWSWADLRERINPMDLYAFMEA